MSIDSPDKNWICATCGWIYDEAQGAPDHGIPGGTAWEHVPADWTCPDCGLEKSEFHLLQDT